jgi:hypothetical protein
MELDEVDNRLARPPVRPARRSKSTSNEIREIQLESTVASRLITRFHYAQNRLAA